MQFGDSDQSYHACWDSKIWAYATFVNDAHTESLEMEIPEGHRGKQQLFLSLPASLCSASLSVLSVC